MICSMIPRTHRAPTEITLIFCTEFYYHANIITNDNTRSLEKFLYDQAKSGYKNSCWYYILLNLVLYFARLLVAKLDTHA